MGKALKSVFKRNYFFDGLLIVFSVLFALFINNIAENIKVANQKEIALNNIEQEIQRNSSVLESWNSEHIMISNRIESLVTRKNDTLWAEMLKYDYFNIGILTQGKPLVNETISNTAWETAKSTGIISEFDFKTTQKLTEVYMLQELILQKTMMRIIDLLFDPTANNIKNIEATVVQLHRMFNELVGQEYILRESYLNILENLPTE